VFYRKDQLPYHLLDRLLPYNDAEKMHGRFDAGIDNYAVTFCSLRSLLRMLIVRIRANSAIMSYLDSFTESGFANKVLRTRKKSEKMLISYDCYSYELYKRLKNFGAEDLIKVLDMASIPTNSIVRIMNRERSVPSSLRYEIDSELARFTDEYQNKRHFEIDHSNYCIVGCTFAKNEMIKYGYPAERLRVVPLGVNANHYLLHKSLYARGGIVRFLFVGRISPAKGINHLLNAFLSLSNEPCELVMVGQQLCSDDYLKPYLATGKVKLCGMLRKDEMADVYQKADAYILSSLYEGFSLSLMEAMASGLPVIASCNSAASDIVSEGVEGFVYDPFDDNALKGYMSWMVSHQERLSTMGRSARELALKYSWSRYNDSLSGVIKLIQNDEGLIDDAR
jgi:glycosyltransferase involved in cell wall biosynthesis